MNRMEELQVGLDIISSLGEKMPALIAGLNEIMREVKDVLGVDEVHRIMGFFKPDGTYPAMFTLGDDEQVKDIKVSRLKRLRRCYVFFLKFSTEKQKEHLCPKILLILLQRGLPL